MAVDTSTAAGRQQVLEGLWMIGMSPDAIKVDTNLPEGEFLKQLNDHGVTSEFVSRAESGVAWRKSDRSQTPLSQNVKDLLAASGYRPDEINKFYDNARTDDPKALLAQLTQQFGANTAGAVMMKATGGKPPDGSTWNPYRTDQQPKGVTFAGNAADLVQDPLAGSAGTRVSQQGQLMTPPKPTAHPGGPPVGIPAGPQAAAQQKGTAPGTPGNNDQTLPVYIPKTDQEISDFIHKNFGQDAWFMDIPEVRQILLDMARTGNTDGDEAIRKVSGTNWYKGTSSDARQWYADERSDPGTTQDKIAKQVTFLQSQASAEGIDIDPARLSALAASSLRYNWTPTQIRNSLSAEFKYDPTSTQQASTIGSMKGIASDYMVPLSDSALQSWDKGLSTGQYTTSQFTEYVKSVSKSLFPQLSAAIDAGHTVQNYVDPYRQVAAQALEVAPDSIDFMNDPRYRSAMDQVDPKTGMHSMMSLGDFQQKIKTDPQYGYDKTTQGVNAGASLATQILQKFGKVT